LEEANMAAASVDYTRHFDLVMKVLTSQGLLLGGYDPAGNANLMTIGWGSIGSVWGMPMWTVLVRPSRHTYACLEHSGAFSVAVPTPAMKPACGLCGSKSGRDMDKFAACHLTARPGEAAKAPDVLECPIVYQCQVVHSNDVVPPRLAGEIQAGFYKSGDYHRVYFGRIVAVRIDADAAARLAE
jgi:flavin reductase (DIM6/NTAB) family NADH-FMN oxidoreductase RutF